MDGSQRYRWRDGDGRCQGRCWRGRIEFVDHRLGIFKDDPAQGNKKDGKEDQLPPPHNSIMPFTIIWHLSAFEQMPDSNDRGQECSGADDDDSGQDGGSECQFGP